MNLSRFLQVVLSLSFTIWISCGEILLGTPFQHEQLDLHSSHARRFPVLDELLLQSPESLHKDYAPSENITNWSDDSCPVFLMTGDVVVCGNLFVRGKLTVLTAVNTTVFEEVDDGIELKTQKLSRFVATRCTKQVPHRLPGLPPVCTTRGNLVVPRAGLLISGTLTVFGSAVTGSLTIDGAASVAMGVATFLNMHTGPTRLVRAARRSTRRIERPVTPQFLPLPHAVWPSAAEHADSLCHSHGDKVPDALFLPKGMLFLRNHASLFTFGKAVAKLVGLDRTSMWLSRCGGVVTADHEGNQGDIILMSASTFSVTGEHSRVEANNLIASEGSLVAVEGAVHVSELVKVTLGSTLAISRDIEVFDLAIADSSTLSVTRSLTVRDLALLSGGRILVGGNFDALSLEAYDQGEVHVKREMNVAEYIVADEGARLDIKDGGCSVGGACLLANHSEIRVATTLTVGEDLRTRSGVKVKAPSATIGCAFALGLFSEAEFTDSLKVREVEILKRALDEDKMDLPHCDPATPIVMVQKSKLSVDKTLAVGGRAIPAANEDPSLAIFANSEVRLGGYVAPTKRHATILKGATKLYVARSEAATDAALLRPGQLLTLEAASQLHGIGLDAVELKAVELSELSQAVFGAGSVSADWLTLRSRSKLDLMNFTPLLLRRGLEVSEDSKCQIAGGLTLDPTFDHLLVSTGSEVRIAGRCGQHGPDGALKMRGSWIAQDSGSIVIDATLKAEPNSTHIAAESNSQIEMSCFLDNELEAFMTFKKTPESQINVASSALPIRPIVYRLKVPPNDAGTLRMFTNGTMNRAGREHARRNSFWDAWQRAAVNLTFDEAPARRATALFPTIVEEVSTTTAEPRRTVAARSRRRRDL